MPVDYSKWVRRSRYTPNMFRVVVLLHTRSNEAKDALELSDDSDIEVHPNVDKKSFIRAKQNQIHQDRVHRKNQIELLKYERQINDGLIKRISALLASLRAHASEASTRNPAEVAFKAVLESAGKPEDDKPPPRPEGVAAAPEGQEHPTFSKMMAQLLDQVNKALDEKKPENRFEAMVDEVQEHENKVKKLQEDLIAELAKLEKEEKGKITSDGYRDGFSSSHVNKRVSADGGSKGKDTQVELLNPNVSSSGAIPAPSSNETLGEEDEGMEASPAAKRFAQIKANDYQASLGFLTANPQILTEQETDGLLVLAFDAALEKKDDHCRQCVHQALLLQYCRALGRDGVAMFFKRITTKGHQAQEMFYKDVQDTYMRIRNRSREIIKERIEEEAQGAEQIQLHPMEPGQTITIQIPPKDSGDDEIEAARKVYDGFSEEMKKALETGNLDNVNEVLGRMKVDEAEELVGLFGEAGVLSMEEELIDATTKEGKDKLKAMEEAAKRESSATEEQMPTGDPE